MSYQPPEDPVGGGAPPPQDPTATPPPGGYPQPGAAPYGQEAPYGQGAPYGQTGYVMPVDHPQGVTVLILGIVGLFICPVVAPVAWVMGNSAIKEIDANPGAYGNRSTVQIGRILGIIATAFIVLSIVGVIAIVAIAAVGSG